MPKDNLEFVTALQMLADFRREVLSGPIGELAESMRSMRELLRPALEDMRHLRGMSERVNASSAFAEHRGALDDMRRPFEGGARHCAEPYYYPLERAAAVRPPVPTTAPQPRPEGVIDLEVRSRCRNCKEPLPSEAWVGRDSWAATNKYNLEVRHAVCERCIRACGGDPSLLPPGDKSPPH